MATFSLSLMAKCEQKHEMSYKTAKKMAKSVELQEICFKTATSLRIMTKYV